MFKAIMNVIVAVYELVWTIGVYIIAPFVFIYLGVKEINKPRVDKYIDWSARAKRMEELRQLELRKDIEQELAANM